MAELAQVSVLATQGIDALDSPRHSLLVRVTHWINTVSFLALVISGIAILLAHPRLYWGETGAVGAPSLIDLPLPFILDIPIRGPGRYLHFLSAWVWLLNGLLYAISGLVTQHFRKNLLPAQDYLGWRPMQRVMSGHLHLRRPIEAESQSYNVLQRLSYLGVIFVLSPLIIVTGLAMSPAVTSVLPIVVNIFGGQQSARTIHFFISGFLVLFLCVHVGMVCLAGFVSRTRAMITGYSAARKERS
jgi:thiosulfate reductase cytochrome b subunit